MLRFDLAYKVQIGDDLGSPTYWNSRWQDIDVRVNACESFTGSIDQAISDVIAQGLNRIDTTLVPIINTLVDQVNSLTAEVDNLENTVVSDQQSVTQQLQALLTQAQGIVNNLQTLGAVQGGTF